MSSEGSGTGKAVGCAAVGAGGILALVLKSTSAEVHVAEVGARAVGREIPQLGAIGGKAGARPAARPSSRTRQWGPTPPRTSRPTTHA